MSAIPSERPEGRALQIANFLAEARRIADARSAEKFTAALKALISPDRNFRPPLRKTRQSKSEPTPSDQPDSR